MRIVLKLLPPPPRRTAQGCNLKAQSRASVEKLLHSLAVKFPAVNRFAAACREEAKRKGKRSRIQNFSLKYVKNTERKGHLSGPQ